MQSTNNTARLFVSHSHEDDPFCLRLIADLRARLGEEAVWYDTSGGLHGSDDWWDRIIAEISERPYFLVVLSPHASESRWVPQEMKIAFRQHVELGKRLLPVRLAPSPRRPDWQSIQEFGFTHADDPAFYANALAELMLMFPKDPSAHVSAPAIPVSIAAGAEPDRPLSATERLAREAHRAYAREHWSDVLDKTEILVERGAMTPALWRERASAAFALNDNNVGLAVIKQALKVGSDDSDTLLLYVRLTTKAGDDAQAVEILTRAYALVSLDDTATRLVILDALTAALARAGRWDDFARRVNDARRIAPNDLRWALCEVEVLLRAGRDDESFAAARSLPPLAGTDTTTALLPAWRSAISVAAAGPADAKRWLTFRALLDAATAAGVDASDIAQWRFEFPHFVPLITLSGPGGVVQNMVWSTLSGPGGVVQNMVWSPNSARLAISTTEGVQIWDTASGQMLCALSGPKGGLAWSPDSTRVATAGGGSERIWDANSGQLLATLHLTAVAAGVRWALGNLSGSYQPPSQRVLDSGAWSPNGAWIATTSSDRDVLAQIWDAASGRLFTTLPGESYRSTNTSVAWSPSGALLATSNSEIGNVVQIWDVATTHLLVNLADCAEPVAWSPDSTRLAVSGKDGVIVWNVASARRLITLADESMGVQDLAWSPDGTRLVIRGLVRRDSTRLAGIWEAASGRQIATLSGHGNASLDMSWSSDGRRLVGTMFSFGPTMWDAASGQEIGNLTSNFVVVRRSDTDPIPTWSWAPGGDRLAASFKTVTIWGEE